MFCVHRYYIVDPVVVSWIAINKGRETGTRAAGDYKFNPLGIKSNKEWETKEVSNGRLAMFAASGMILQGLTTHDSALGSVGL